MHPPVSTFRLPPKLLEACAQDGDRQGYLLQVMLAAALVTFLESSPEEREQIMFRLADYLLEPPGEPAAGAE